MPWLLIFFLQSPWGPGFPASASFADQPSCLAALASLRLEEPSIRGVCVQRGGVAEIERPN